MITAAEQTNFHHELPHSIFSLLAARVARQHSALSCRGRPRGRRSWVRRVRRVDRIRVHQQHELDVSACEEAVDVVILVGVYPLQISTRLSVSIDGMDGRGGGTSPCSPIELPLPYLARHAL